jgi:hypothetical protein
MSAQLHQAENRSPEELPPLMCPQVARLAVGMVAEHTANAEADSYVASPGAMYPVQRDELLTGVEAIADGYNDLADRCARKLVHKGWDHVSLEEVQTIETKEILSAVANVAKNLSNE